MQFGGLGNKILLDGTSSSGKTTIAKIFEENGYKYISSDEYTKQGFIEFLKKLPNEYLLKTQKEKTKMINEEIRRLMYEESKMYDKVIIDDIQQDILDFIPREKIFIIIIYASLKDLTRNIISRKIISYRGLFVFEQFAKRYIKTDVLENNIDKINVNEFIEILKQIKYEFESEEKLIEFAKDIFKKMNIDDNNDHYIKLRDEYYYDYILNISEKTPEEIYKELIAKGA